jgi:hypothetical protein
MAYIERDELNNLFYGFYLENVRHFTTIPVIQDINNDLVSKNERFILRDEIDIMPHTTRNNVRTHVDRYFNRNTWHNRYESRNGESEE